MNEYILCNILARKLTFFSELAIKVEHLPWYGTKLQIYIFKFTIYQYFKNKGVYSHLFTYFIDVMIP